MLRTDAHLQQNAGHLHLSWQKRVVFSFISILFVVILLSLLGELGIRLFTRLVPRYRSGPFRQYDPVLGVSLLPNRSVPHSRGCFNGLVVTNSWGMRDRDRSLSKPPGDFRIVLLGDSLVESVHVQPEEVVNIRMEKLLRDEGYGNIEVMNFGVGGFGTTQELLIYKERVRRFHPDLVVLLWFDNDVMNNSSTLQPKAYGIHTWYCPYYDLGPHGELIFRPVEKRAFSDLRSFLELHSLLTYYVERIWDDADVPLYKWKGLPFWMGIYGDRPDAEWEQAWTLTGRLMSWLNQTVENDGIKLIYLIHPGFFEIDPEWKERLAMTYGKSVAELPGLRPEQIDERLEEIAARNALTLDLLYPYFQAYRDAHHLKSPYFSFTCEKHFSALGNEVTAEAIVQKLKEHGLLPPLGGGAQRLRVNSIK